MRKWMAALLSLLLLLSLLPAAAAAAEDAAAEGVEALPEPEAARAETELLPPVEVPEVPELLDGGAGETGPEPEAGGGTVNVTVTLPEAVQSRSYVTVSLYKAPEIADGSVTEDKELFESRGAVVAPGERTGSAAFTGVPDGRYILSAEAAVNSGKTLGVVQYYNGDGTAARSAYTAAGFAVSGGSVSKSLTIPTAKHSLSGTVSFSAAPEKDSSVWLYAYGTEMDLRSCRSRIDIPAGETSVPFAIGIEEGVYYLQASCSGKSYVYSVEGELTDASDTVSRMFFSTANGDHTGLALEGDGLIGESAMADVTVNVKLPAALTEARSFQLTAFTAADVESGSWSYAGTYGVEEGAAEFSGTLSVMAGETYAFCYLDVTACGVRSVGSFLPTARYAAEGGGSTTAAKNAALFPISGDRSVEIAAPESYVLRGTLDRGSQHSGRTSAAFAVAELPDGERYAARVLFGAEDTTADYAIYVPKSEQGEICALSAAQARGRTGTVAADGWSEAVTLTLQDSAELEKIVLPVLASPDVTKVTFSLPDGVTAPEGGQAVYAYGSEGYVRGVIPAGANSVVAAVPSTPSRSYAYLDGALDGVYYKAMWSEGDRYEFQASATLSGTVTLPSNHSGGYSGRLDANVGKLGFFLSVSALPGMNSVRYAFSVPRGAAGYLQLSCVYDGSGVLDGVQLYMGSDWTVSERYVSGPEIAGDRSGVDFTYPRKARVSGSLAASDGGLTISTAPYSVFFYLEPAAGGAQQAIQGSLDTDGNWSFPMDPALAGSCYLFCDLYNLDSDILPGRYYYTGSETEYSSLQSDAALLELGEDGLSGVTICVATAWRLTGSLVLPEGGFITPKDGTQSSGTCYVRVQPDSGGIYGKNIPIDPEKSRWDYQFLLPKEAKRYTVSTTIYSSDLVKYDTNIVFDFAAAAVTVDVMGDGQTAQDLILPLKRTEVRAEILRPEGIDGYLSGTLYLRTAAATYEASFSLGAGADRQSLSVAIPVTDESESCRMYYNCWKTGLARAGYLTGTGISAYEEDAADLPLTDAGADYSITPIETAPFLVGRVYVPEGVTEPFTLLVDLGKGSGLEPVSVRVDPAKGPYAEFVAESTRTYLSFPLSYTVTDDAGGRLDASAKAFYVGIDGQVTRTQPGSGETAYPPFRLNFTPLTPERYVFESGHDLAAGSYSYTYTVPGADAMDLTFGRVEGTVTAGGSPVSEGGVVHVDGGTVTVTVLHNGGSACFGFGVKSVAASRGADAPPLRRRRRLLRRNGRRDRPASGGERRADRRLRLRGGGSRRGPGLLRRGRTAAGACERGCLRRRRRLGLLPPEKHR